MGVLKITPRRQSLTEKRYKLIFGHSPQTIITGVVRMRYPLDMEHLGYNIRSDHNVHTSNARRKLSTKELNPCMLE